MDKENDTDLKNSEQQKESTVLLLNMMMTTDLESFQRQMENRSIKRYLSCIISKLG